REPIGALEPRAGAGRTIRVDLPEGREGLVLAVDARDRWDELEVGDPEGAVVAARALRERPNGAAERDRRDGQRTRKIRNVHRDAEVGRLETEALEDAHPQVVGAR